MNCPLCGAALSAAARFCQQCGAPRPQLDPRFQKVEQEVARLREERKSGRLGQDGYKAALSALMLQHEGRWWMLGAESGQWYVNECGRWVGAAPPSGSPVVAGGLPRSVKAQREFAYGGNRISCVAISPDGRHALGGCDDFAMRIWDIESGHEMRRLYELGRPEGSNGLMHAAFSPTGRYIVAGYGGGCVRIWETANFKEVRCLQAHSEWADFVAFMPDGRHVLSAGSSLDNTVALWNLVDGSQVFRVRGEDSLTKVAVSRDGSWFLAAWGVGADLRLYDAKNGRELHRFKDVNEVVGALAFSPDARSFVVNAHTHLLVVETSTGKTLGTIFVPSEIRCVAFTPDGLRVLGGGGPVMPDVHEVDTAFTDAFVKELRKRPMANKLHMWDVATNREVLRGSGHSDEITALAVSADGRFALTGGADGTARLWPLS
jgi:WD40 repeat protein